jgi:hypothetical protein
MDHNLVGPSDADLGKFFREVHPLPSDWVEDLDEATPEFKRWLADLNVYDLWEMDEEARAAMGFLSAGKIRNTFETLVLLHGDIADARAELTQSVGERRVPSVSALEVYCLYFWDVLSMSKPGIFEYMAAQQNDGYKLAVEGERDTVYAMLGIRRPVDPVATLDMFIQLAHLETSNFLKQGGFGSAQRAIGHATTMKAMMDAIAMRMDLSKASSESDMRKDAQLFKARIVPRAPVLIPSIDELPNDVIDADELGDDDEEDPHRSRATIHRLPARR